MAGTVAAAAAATSTTTYRLVGFPVSQPTRAVAWALTIRGIPFEWTHVRSLTGGCLTDEFLSKYPLGTIPVLEVYATGQKTDSGSNSPPFRLAEGNAILQYLATKHGWEDWYPAPQRGAADEEATLQRRAVIDQWLHFHHGNLRPATLHYFRPMARVAMGDQHFQGPMSVDDMNAEFAKGAKVLRDAFLAMEWGAFRRGQQYLAPGDTPSIADIAAYCELDQMRIIGGRFAEPLAEFELVRGWMDRMAMLPAHDDVRKELREISASKLAAVAQ